MKKTIQDWWCFWKVFQHKHIQIFRLINSCKVKATEKSGRERGKVRKEFLKSKSIGAQFLLTRNSVVFGEFTEKVFIPHTSLLPFFFPPLSHFPTFPCFMCSLSFSGESFCLFERVEDTLRLRTKIDSQVSSRLSGPFAAHLPLPLFLN